MTAPTPTLGVIGPVRVAYGITADGHVHLAQPGGGALYASAGARVWAERVTVLSRATQATLSAISALLLASDIDTSGIRLIPGDESELEFHAATGDGAVDPSNPAAHFLRIGHTLPKALLGFHPPERPLGMDKPTDDLTVRIDDLPNAPPPWLSAHLTPSEYFSQATLPGRLQELGVRGISLDPAPGLMDPARRLELGTVVRSTHAFLPSEEEVLDLYRPRRPDLWECAEDLAGLGPETIVVKRGPLGALVWNSAARARWNVPAYPAAERDRFGVGDAFCGGFAAGLVLTGDPVEAALRGAVSASLAIEGFGALYPLGATQGLAQARLDALRDVVQRI